MKETLLTSLRHWGPPVLTIVIGILLGWIFRRFFHSRIKKLTDKTRWKGDDVVLAAVEKYILLWFFLGAVSLATGGIEIAAPYNTYLSITLLALLIFSITMAISKVAVGLLEVWSESQGSRFPSTAIFVNLTRIIIISIGVLIILQTVNISITPILTALGVGGLAVSLALKDTLSDFFAGLHILLSQKVKIGDFVRLDSGEMGYITNITWRNTSMLERANNVITIPNTRLSSAIIKNFDAGDPSFSVKLSVGVAYDSDLKHVERVTQEVANAVVQEVEGAKKDFKPIVRFKEFGESSINLVVYFRVLKYGDHHSLVHTFVKQLHDRYNQEGIEIPFPIRTVLHKNPAP